MIANLPLLFAGGHPVALMNFSAAELEKFITFMVTCSWGHDTVSSEVKRPQWWPTDVPFSHPFVRPGAVPVDWDERLKNLVRKCYTFHNSSFLLVFSAQLARYPRKRLQFVNNLDATTSLYLKPSGRLLVTFRNLNMFYDKDAPIVKEDSIVTDDAIVIDDDVVDDNNTDITAKSSNIYLCDNCDSHFDNIETLNVHERLCNNDVPAGSCNGGLPDFLSALKLVPVADLKVGQTDFGSSGTDIKSKSVRTAANVDRGPPYPFSSLAYTKHIKNHTQRDTTYSRERIERYCSTTSLPNKIVANKLKNQQFPVRYRRPLDYWHRKHVFPEQRHKKILDVNAQLFYLKCRNITVDVERMSVKSMQEYIDKLREAAELKKKNRQDKDIIFVDMGCEPSEVEFKNLDPLKQLNGDCEVIDLCSDDESPGNEVNENCDPRAGVACVMRGGAVLRRTAATPQALPSEPCGARQRPLPTAILQPHPVLLITRSLNNLQTISLE